MPPTHTTHQDVAHPKDAHKEFEVCSAKKGGNSKTNSFEFEKTAMEFLDGTSLKASDSAKSRYVTYNDKFIGTFKTVTKASGQSGKDESYNALVKMHLVNSRFHPEANGWNHNWFWGSLDLNKMHSAIEDEAWKVHPDTDKQTVPPSKLLRYNTKVGELRPNCLTKAKFTEHVLKRLTIKKNEVVGVNKDAILEASSVKIGGYTLDTFYSKWSAATVAHAHSDFVVRYQYIKPGDGNIWTAEIKSGASVSKVVNELYFPEITLVAAATNVWLILFPLQSSGEDEEGRRVSKRVKRPTTT